jgi:hypothetical protein
MILNSIGNLPNTTGYCPALLIIGLSALNLMTLGFACGVMRKIEMYPMHPFFSA